MGAINIDHKKGLITTDEDGVIKITEHGAVKLGSGEYLSELNNSQIEEEESYKGAIRYNKETKTVQYCDGTTWKDFAVGVDETPGIIWSITF